jgi:hypothetical protein
MLVPTDDSSEVDHEDGNGLNNSSLFGRLNIRSVTHLENMQNLHSTRKSAAESQSALSNILTR